MTYIKKQTKQSKTENFNLLLWYKLIFLKKKKKKNLDYWGEQYVLEIGQPQLQFQKFTNWPWFGEICLSLFISQSGGGGTVQEYWP